MPFKTANNTSQGQMAPEEDKKTPQEEE